MYVTLCVHQRGRDGKKEGEGEGEGLEWRTAGENSRQITSKEPRHPRFQNTDFSISTVYRLNTYPLLHWSVFHYLLNTIAFIPLLERFELEQGTIVTTILFTGPFGLLPGGIYTLLERYIFHFEGAAIGASVWIFLLLSSEAMKMYRNNPYFSLGESVQIPTWTSPLFLMLLIHFLMPYSSLLGHLCGSVVGYAWGLGYIKFLAPPDGILKWIEEKLNLLGRLPHFVSVDQKTFGRYGVLPTTNVGSGGAAAGGRPGLNGLAVGPVGSTQRLGP
jgi:membrane associated rhomboid family serine protease